jgi:hypothetical protein
MHFNSFRRQDTVLTQFPNCGRFHQHFTRVAYDRKKIVSLILIAVTVAQWYNTRFLIPRSGVRVHLTLPLPLGQKGLRAY